MTTDPDMETVKATAQAGVGVAILAIFVAVFVLYASMLRVNGHEDNWHPERQVETLQTQVAESQTQIAQEMKR